MKKKHFIKLECCIKEERFIDALFSRECLSDVTHVLV